MAEIRIWLANGGVVLLDTDREGKPLNGLTVESVAEDIVAKGISLKNKDGRGGVVVRGSGIIRADWTIDSFNMPRPGGIIAGGAIPPGMVPPNIRGN